MHLPIINDNTLSLAHFGLTVFMNSCCLLFNRGGINAILGSDEKTQVKPLHIAKEKLPAYLDNFGFIVTVHTAVKDPAALFNRGAF